MAVEYVYGDIINRSCSGVVEYEVNRSCSGDLDLEIRLAIAFGEKHVMHGVIMHIRTACSYLHIYSSSY